MKQRSNRLRRRLRVGVAGLGLTAAGLAAVAPMSTAAPQPDRDDIPYRVLVFTKAVGGQHPAPAAGVEAIRELGDENEFAVQVTSDSRWFDRTHLMQYRAVVFLNTSGDVLTDAQQNAFEAYFAEGGGFVGIGSAVENEPDWQFYTNLIGTRATRKTAVQPGTIKVADRV